MSILESEQALFDDPLKPGSRFAHAGRHGMALGWHTCIVARGLARPGVKSSVT